MVIDITYKCRMNCQHCMVDADVNGEHMSDNVFEQTLRFVKEINPFIVIISGGEPTEHPHFIEYVKRIKEIACGNDKLSPFNNSNRIIITSNGMFDSKIRQQLIDLGVTVQITRDNKYYKISVEYVEHDNFLYINDIGYQPLYPSGRAKDCGSIVNPKCFNVRNMVCNNGIGYKQAVKLMEMNLKSCHPVVRPNGDIILGETIDCKPVGNVFNSIDDITRNIRELSCNNCKMYNYLSAKYTALIRG
ncbi:MAG: radical SAM protein [Syntrophothermus sp.]